MPIYIHLPFTICSTPLKTTIGPSNKKDMFQGQCSCQPTSFSSLDLTVFVCATNTDHLATEKIADCTISSLMSRSRGTAETNTGENIEYSKPVADSLKEIHSVDVLADEQSKGDDEAECSRWRASQGPGLSIQNSEELPVILPWQCAPFLAECHDFTKSVGHPRLV